MTPPISSNPLRTRADLEAAAEALIEPLLPFMSPGHARLHLGDSAAIYSDDAAEMEAYSRPLWAIFPLLAGGSPAGKRYWSLWADGLKHGTDPAHPEYWGDIGDYDQRMVETAVLGYGMLLAPEAFWAPFSPEEKQRVCAYLHQMNLHDMPHNNWRFFRVLVNLGFDRCGYGYPEEVMEEDMALLESHYEADGWYFDSPTQRDYYSIWEFQFDGLVYAMAMSAKDPQRSQRLMQRARAFAPRFAAWFDADCEALPYGRSLTYRFAQSAFFAALALAGCTSEAVGYGQMKRLLLGNLRKWLSRPIFRPDGVLTIGYGYPNQVMADEYNAPGSPYWGMKAFAVLALPEDHPFWQAQEEPFAAPPVFLEEHSRMLLVRNEDNSHVQAFTAGNHCPGHVHGDSKYEKFVYSTLFAFSVSRGMNSLENAGFDSTLALSLDGVWYRPHFGCDSFRVAEKEVAFTAHPFEGVEVETRLIPHGDWHVRVHRIRTDHKLYVAEGGFALARDRNTRESYTAKAEGKSLLCRASWGVSGICAVEGFDGVRGVHATSNTNLLYPRTVIPTLTATLEAGEHVLACAVLGTTAQHAETWAEMLAAVENGAFEDK